MTARGRAKRSDLAGVEAAASKLMKSSASTDEIQGALYSGDGGSCVWGAPVKA